MTSNDPSSKLGPFQRLRTWARRYGAAEITGTLTAYLGYFSVLGMTQNDLASAYGGSVGESVGFFGMMIIREIAADRSKARRRLGSYDWKGMRSTARGLFMEFGPAELLDTGLIGPLAMGTASYYLGPAIGILVGKLASDLTFYGSAILAREMRRKWALTRAKGGVNPKHTDEELMELRDVVDALTKSEVFGTVSHEDLEFLARMFQRRDFADTEAVCQRGDEATEFYVVKDGQVEIKIHPDGPTLATLGRSAVIGEYAIFSGSKRTASIIAKGPVTLLALDYERFHRFMLAFPESTIALLKAAVLRQLETQDPRNSES